jgi:hypothetical protein
MELIIWNGGGDGHREHTSRTIGPYKVAHWIRKHGYGCQVIDFINYFSPDDLYRVTKKFITPDTLVLAVSTTFLLQTHFGKSWYGGNTYRTLDIIIEVLQRIKEEFPKIKIILGGNMADKISSWGIIDASIMNYLSASEEIMLEYLNHLKFGHQPPLGKIIFPFLLKEKDRPNSPRMHYDGAREKKYNIEIDDFKFTKQDCILPGEPLPLDVSRGCIFACKFCVYPHTGKKKLDYIRGMEYIEEELRYNYENFNTTHYYVLDDTFNDTEHKLKEFHKTTERLPFDIRYTAYLRADLIHRFPDTAILLKESGLFGAYHGIETFHPEASMLIGKAWSGKHAKTYLPKLLHDVWNDEVPMHLNFIAGLPKDTEENMLQILSWFIDNDMFAMNIMAFNSVKEEDGKFGITSEFRKNPEKYGIEYPDDNDPYYWKHETCDWKRAKILETDIRTKAIDASKCHSWYIPFFMAMGNISKQQILTVKRLDLYDMVRGSRLKMTSKYYRMLMNL